MDVIHCLKVFIIFIACLGKNLGNYVVNYIHIWLCHIIDMLIINYSILIFKVQLICAVFCSIPTS